jgi:hypothetical protein
MPTVSAYFDRKSFGGAAVFIMVTFSRRNCPPGGRYEVGKAAATTCVNEWRLRDVGTDLISRKRNIAAWMPRHGGRRLALLLLVGLMIWTTSNSTSPGRRGHAGSTAAAEVPAEPQVETAPALNPNGKDSNHGADAQKADSMVKTCANLRQTLPLKSWPRSGTRCAIA